MKTKTFTIVFFAFLITLLCDAQNVELAKSEQTGLWEYSEVIESDGSASDILKIPGLGSKIGYSKPEQKHSKFF